MKFKYIFNLLLLVTVVACNDEDKLYPRSEDASSISRFEFPQGNSTWDQDLEEIANTFGTIPIYTAFDSLDLNQAWSGTYTIKYRGEPLSDDYAAFYSSKTARTKLITNLMQEARQYGYDGYNIDFEYVKKDFADDYLQFLRELSIACQNNGLVLSVDNYKPANHNAHYELAEQAVFVDYIVIMGYDEHYAGSDAGSVASLPFVEDGISRAVSMVPSEQVINAVPFYTRIWTENAGETKSRAVGMKAAMDAMQENGATAECDETTGQYYCTYETSAGTVQIWFEEDRSIGEKMKLYSKYKLGGVAEWKLGLETSSVWSIISNGLNYAS